MQGIVSGWEVGLRWRVRLVPETGKEGTGWVVTSIFIVSACAGGPVHAHWCAAAPHLLASIALNLLPAAPEACAMSTSSWWVDSE